MRSDLVVVPTPDLDDDLRINSIAKPLHQLALIAEHPVEGLVGAVLPRLSGLYQRRFDVLLGEPIRNRAGEEFRPFIRAQIPPSAMDADQLGEHLLVPCAADAAAQVDRQRLARVFVDHGEAFELLTVGAGVEDEVVCPHLPRTGWRQRTRTRAGDSPPRRKR